MDENKRDIVDEYFKAMAHCHAIECQKVIFEPLTKKEWFLKMTGGVILNFFANRIFTGLLLRSKRILTGVVCFVI